MFLLSLFCDADDGFGNPCQIKSIQFSPTKFFMELSDDLNLGNK